MYCDVPDFTRCCFCLPLRLGVLVFGYLNVLFSVLLVGLYSYTINTDIGLNLMFHGAAVEAAEEICIALYILELLVNVGLIYGAHRQHLFFIKIFFYYAIATTVAAVLMEIVALCNLRHISYGLEAITLAFCGLCFQLYLIGLVRSLIKKLSIPSSQLYENPLQQIVAGEVKNEIYEPNTVVIA